MALLLKKYCRILGFLAALLLNTVAALNCQDLMQENLNCFTKAGVTINEEEFRLAVSKVQQGGENQYLEDTLKKDPGSVCGVNSEKEKMKKAIRCQMDVIGQCQPSVRDFVPSGDQMADYIDFYCQHEKEIDLNCAQTKTGEINNCAKAKATAYIRQHGSPRDTDGLHKLLCEAYTIAADCQAMSLRSCDNPTRTILSQITRDYLTPEACLGVAWVPSLFMTLLLAIVTSQLFF